MTKEQESFEFIKNSHFCGYDPDDNIWYESGVIKDWYDDEVNCIDIALKVLEIIKTKNVNIQDTVCSTNVTDYNYRFAILNKELTLEEFNLIKEYFNGQ